MRGRLGSPPFDRIVEPTACSGQMNGTILANATLIGASFDSASLISTNFSNANLDSAILTNADLLFAILIGADLSTADLTSADLSSANLSGALYDGSTIFPSGSTYDIPPWGLPNDATPWDAGMIPVPEPSARLLLLFGAMGLAGLAAMKGGV